MSKYIIPNYTKNDKIHLIVRIPDEASCSTYRTQCGMEIAKPIYAIYHTTRSGKAVTGYHTNGPAPLVFEDKSLNRSPLCKKCFGV